MKKLVLFTFVLTFVVASYAQDTDSTSTNRESRRERKETRRKRIAELSRQAEEGILIYSKQSIFGLQLKTNGYGAFYELGKMKSNRKTNIYRIDITETKEHKEEKLLTNNFFGNSFIYGKINYFYPVTIGLGQQYIFGQKGNKNGVAVSGIYNVGLSLGLLRPYYIEVRDGSNEAKTIKYNPDDSASSALFLSESSIIGGGGFGKGWSEIKVKPGAFAKIAMRFDYGRFNESVNGLEIGVSAEYYGSKIPIMLFQKDRNLFLQAYIAILFGKRK